MNKEDNYKVRAQFLAGKQTDFIHSVLLVSGFSIESLAKFLEISSRTLRDWRREKFTMTDQAVKKLCEAFHMVTPEYQALDPYWYTAKGGMLGSQIVHKKYGPLIGSDAIRRQKWQEWWELSCRQ